MRENGGRLMPKLLPCARAACRRSSPFVSRFYWLAEARAWSDLFIRASWRIQGPEGNLVTNVFWRKLR